jgi:hypothetical protein
VQIWLPIKYKYVGYSRGVEKSYTMVERLRIITMMMMMMIMVTDGN